MSLQRPPVVIDLTISDDDDDKVVLPQHVSSTTGKGLPARFQSSRPPTAVSIRSNASLQAPGAQPPSAARTLKQEPSEVNNSFVVPPAKRRRTGSEERKFGAYLQETLWPAVHETLEELLPDCEHHTKERIHFTTNQSIIDGPLNREWAKSGGKVSREFEASLSGIIQQLILELKDNPERLRTLPTVKGEFLPTRKHGIIPIVPSVEADLDPPAYDRPSPTEPLHQHEAQHLEAPFYYNNVRSKPRVEGSWRFPLKKQALHITPQHLRAGVKATQWQSGKAFEAKGGNRSDREGTANSLFGLSSRPYTPASIREEVLGEDLLLPLAELELRKPTTFHIDFSDGEIKYLQYVARVLYGSNTQIPRRPVADLRHLYKKAVKTNRKRDIIEAHQRRYEGFEIRPPIVLTSRSPADLKNFLFDLHYRKAKQVSPHIITLSRDDLDTRGDTTRIDRVPALLYTREVVGNRAFGSIRRYEDFATAFKTEREDAFEPQMEWTNCAGDISTISWVSKTQFICGTTTHSDSHNQQYNKPGNLLLGSSQGTLRAYPDHRIIRPIVTHGDNALDSMVESQDPWLYSSVVSSDYDAHHDLAFTSSFDKTVKIWKVRDGSMEALGTWEHEGRVNFVLASKHRYGMVATAADVLTNAVRVYHIRDSLARQQGRFDSYSCTKIHEEEYVPSEKWGYCPAAIQWGVAPDVQHLLLVGYSPRSLSGDDRDIAEDRINTGELCLWDAYSRTQVKVNSLATQNVFEVAWHPSRDSFAAATSKTMSMEKIDKGIKTQIRIFARNLDGQYGTIKTLDCQAADINELAIRPNSRVYSYVAAACTNGNAYVWDTAGSDDPMCVLEHGESVEELLGEREQEDVGVKFLAWGTTADRLYTGSSDGVVKVWNIRHGKAVHVRDLIEAAGPVICGAFSPDYTKLAIGDGSGRVHLVGLDEKESEDETERPPVSGPGFFKLQLGRSQKVIRRPRPLMPHPEPPPPNANSSETKLQLGQERARGYLERGQVILNPHPNIGAVQGPNYSSTGLFRAEAHRDDDVTQPLLGAFERKQQENILYYGYRKPSRLRKIRDPQALWAVHEQNSSLDLDVKGLHPDTRAQLEADGVELDVVLNSDGSDYNSNDNESE